MYVMLVETDFGAKLNGDGLPSAITIRAGEPVQKST